MSISRVFMSLALLTMLVGGWYALSSERLLVSFPAGGPFDPSSALAADQTPRSFTPNAIRPRFPGAVALLAPLTSAEHPSGNGRALTRLLTGRFRGVAHASHGMATVYELADGTRILRLTDFATSIGPDVQVCLDRGGNRDAVASREDLVRIADLKDHAGDQNYELPSDLDLSQVHAITIWSRRLSLTFATAPLVPAQS